jgi:hypothetical protein
MNGPASRASRPARTALIVLASLLVSLASACVLFVGWQPPSYAIRRGTAVQAPEARVHALLSDVRALAAWDPWPARRPVARTTTFSPTSTGLGAWAQWSSPDGTLRMTVVSDTSALVEYRCDSNGRVDATRQRFESRRASGLTTIDWTVSGKTGLLGRALWPFANLEGRVGPDMEASLARLRAILDGA